MEDLGLSLSLATPVARSSMPSFPLMHHPQQKRHWTDLIASSVVAERTRPVISGIDVNSVPAVERGGSNEDEEDLGVSSPNSTLSSVSAGKREQREESETGRAFSGGGGHTSDDEDGGDGSRKKLRLSKDQSAILEESFKEHNTLNPKQKLALAKQLNLRPRQVEVWFQNRRARTKLKQTEVDCEFLKRCCENLTEENRKLLKEVQDLRALKLSPQFYMQMTPPTTLTMCPSCERVAVSSSAAAPTTTSTTTSSPQTDAHQQRSSSNCGGVSSGVNLQCPQQPQQQHPFFMHRPTPIAGVGMPVLPWAPTPLRASKFLDLTSQRS